MKTSDYEALIGDSRPGPDEIRQRQQVARLKEIARNLESLGTFADAEAKTLELEAKPVEE